MKTKVCKGCNKELELNSINFYRKLKYFSNKCKPCSKIDNKTNYRKHRDKYLEQKKKYWLANRDKITEYRKENQERDKAVTREYVRKRKKEDPIYKFRVTISKRIFSFFKNKGYKKSQKTVEILGCTYSEMYEHLKKTFESNYQVKWSEEYLELLHIDHIIPLSSGTSKEELIELNHYTNLQFLYYKDNLSKKDQINWTLDLEETEFFTHVGIDNEQ